MADSRKTRKRKFHDSRRQTRRATAQRGGAAWPTIPDDFADALVAKGFPTLKRLKQTAPNSESVTDELIMEDYIRCLERQDDIFEVALDLIRSKVAAAIGGNVDLSRPEDVATNIDRINAMKAEIAQPYIDAAESLITFIVDTEVTDETKLQEIRSAKIPLSILLLFPAKLSNLLVTALANIFVAFKDNKAALLQSSSTTEILAAQYEGYAQSLAYTLTARPLRDGFFLNQGIDSFKEEIQTDFSALTPTKFWPTFVTALYENRNMGVDEILNLFTHDRSTEEGCAHISKGARSTWGQIAADVFTYHELKPTGDILELFSENCSAPSTYDATFVPDERFLDVAVRGTTMRRVLSNLDDTTLQFILQLSHAIKTAITE
jgi:hypothetical protein